MRTLLSTAFNVTLAAAALLVLAVPLALIMLAIKSTSPGAVLFRQQRVGKDGRIFSIYKFRTMIDAAPSETAGVAFGESRRLTPIGGMLRRRKLDELPQLVNILRGEMNVVGPRPEVPEFVAKYSAVDRAVVLSVKPGLTDFASIRFRDEARLLAAQPDPTDYYVRRIMPAKLRYCRFYVRRAGIRLDLFIIMLTLRALAQDALPGRRSARRPHPAFS